jgi:hypothetical protein
MVDELKEVGRTAAEVATDITRDLGGEDMQISPLEFARIFAEVRPQRSEAVRRG